MRQAFPKQRVLVITLVLILFAAIAIILWSMHTKNHNWISKLAETSHNIKLSETIGASETVEHILSKEESKELLQILDLENLDFTDDILKSGFETIYLIELDRKHVFRISRFLESPEDGFYITYLKSGILKKVYLGTRLDEDVVASIKMMLERT